MDKHPAPTVKVETVPGSKPGVVIVRVRGPLEIGNFAVFQDVIQRSEAAVLIVDLREVPYIDSAVLGSMVATHVSSARNRRKFAVANANERISNMLMISGVREVLTVFTTLSEAEAALTSAAH